MNTKTKLLLIPLLTFCCSCSGSADPWTEKRPKPVPVSGQIKLRGNPLGNAVVVFRSEEFDTTSYGKTDESGRYKLTTYSEKDGAPLGGHKVTVQKYEEIPPPSDPENSPKRKGEFEPKSLVPEEYSEISKTILKASVTEKGVNQFDFDLK